MYIPILVNLLSLPHSLTPLESHKMTRECSQVGVPCVGVGYRMLTKAGQAVEPGLFGYMHCAHGGTPPSHLFVTSKMACAQACTALFILFFDAGSYRGSIQANAAPGNLRKLISKVVPIVLHCTALHCKRRYVPEGEEQVCLLHVIRHNKHVYTDEHVSLFPRRSYPVVQD